MQQILQLRRILDLPREPKKTAARRCEMCNTELGDEHSHVVDLVDRRLVCACRPCYLLFTNKGAAGGRYRSAGDRYVDVSPAGSTAGSGAQGSVADALWAACDLPVNTAFFVRSAASNRVLAFYPSPAGATESGLSTDRWDDIVQSDAVLGSMESDVEALLIRRAREGAECWIVPVDACYELVGRIRQCWRGFDGGSDVRNEIDTFFTGLRRRAQGASA